MNTCQQFMEALDASNLIVWSHSDESIHALYMGVKKVPVEVLAPYPNGWEGIDLTADPEYLRVFKEALARIRRHVEGGNAYKASLYLDNRVPADAPAHRHPGWLELIIRLHYEKPGANRHFCGLTIGLTIGVIQRQPGAEVESHS